MKRKKSEQKRILNRPLNEKLVSLMVIFVMIFYPLLFPLWIVRAQEELAITTDTSVDAKPAPSENKTEPDNTSKQTDTKDIKTETSSQQPAEDATKNEDPGVEAEKKVATDKKPVETENTDNTARPLPTNETESVQLEVQPGSTTGNNDNGATTTDSSASKQPISSDAANPTNTTNTNAIAGPSETPQQDTPTEDCKCLDVSNTSDAPEASVSRENNPPNNNNCCPTTTIKNNNDTEITNAVDSASDTGNNTINDPQNPISNSKPSVADTASDSQTDKGTQLTSTEKKDEPIANAQPTEDAIATGNAASDSTIVNEANTNIVSDNYIDSVINITGDKNYDINLLDQFQGLLTTAQGLNSSNLESLNVENNNNANVTNDAQAIANSGSNTIVANGTTENSQITTGDASADANVINIINRNLIGNTWIFSVINVLGNWIGDLIVPGEGLLQMPASQVATNLEVTNENNASITNNINANANSGENSIANANTSSIVTGETSASANATNLTNTNIVQNNWFVLLINNLGIWSGKISNQNDTGNGNTYEYNFESNNETNFFTSLYSFLSVHNINQATITNNTSANATTGNNSITGNSDSATIQTGNASASANAVNIINTNIVGNNWMFTVVNIMGSWTGNVVAAYPDLTLSINDGIQQTESGSLLTYMVSYENIGQATSNDAKIEVKLPDALTYQASSAQQEPTLKNSIYAWSLGKTNAGEKKSFTFTALANNDGEPAPISVSANISTSTKEIALLNNSASDETIILSKQITQQKIQQEIQDNTDVNFTNNESNQDDPNSQLKISRLTKNISPMLVGNTTDQVISVENKGDDSLSDIVLTETILNPNNEIIGKYVWPLPALNAHEKVLITYQLTANPNATAGIYTYRARGIAINSIGKKITSNKASNGIAILAMYHNNNQQGVDIASANINNDDAENPGSQEVLGATTTKTDSLPLWLLVIFAALCSSAGIAWLMSRKLKLKTIPLKENLLRNRTNWETVHEIQPKK